MTCLVSIILMALGVALSWGVTCGLVWLVCLCFDLTFSWAIATGIWLVMLLLRSVFKTVVHKEG